MIRVLDGNGGSDSAALALKITPVNDGPVAVDNAYSGAEDGGSVTGNVITDDTGSGVDSDVDGDPLSVSGFSVAGEAGPFVVGSAYVIAGVGSLTVNGDGSFTFAPVADYNGSVPAVTYTVSDGAGGSDSAVLGVTITPVNDGPVAVDDGPVAVVEDTPVAGNVLDGTSGGLDSDVDGDPLSVTAFTVAGEAGPFVVGSAYGIAGVGSLTVNADGSFTFAPALNYNGPVPSVTYTVSDGAGGSDTGVLSFGPVSPANDAPVAADNAYSGAEDGGSVTGNVITDDTGSGVDADPDGDALSVSGFSVAGEAGPFVVGSAYGIAGVGSLTVNGDGSFTFAPVADYNGSVPAVTYTVSDGNGGSDSAALALTITPVNDGPVAVDNAYSGAEDGGSVTGNVITDDTGSGVDSDVDGDPLSVTAFTLPVTEPPSSAPL